MLKFKAPLDPNEHKDYVRDWTDELTAVNDTISTQDFVLSSEALAAGLVITSQAVDPGNKKAVFWIKSNNVTATRALVGSTINIDHTIVTVGGRTYNETLVLKIMEK